MAAVGDGPSSTELLAALVDEPDAPLTVPAVRDLLSRADPLPPNERTVAPSRRLLLHAYDAAHTRVIEGQPCALQVVKKGMILNRTMRLAATVDIYRKLTGDCFTPSQQLSTEAEAIAKKRDAAGTTPTVTLRRWLAEPPLSRAPLTPTTANPSPRSTASPSPRAWRDDNAAPPPSAALPAYVTAAAGSGGVTPGPGAYNTSSLNLGRSVDVRRCSPAFARRSTAAPSPADAAAGEGLNHSPFANGRPTRPRAQTPPPFGSRSAARAEKSRAGRDSRASSPIPSSPFAAAGSTIGTRTRPTGRNTASFAPRHHVGGGLGGCDHEAQQHANPRGGASPGPGQYETTADDLARVCDARRPSAAFASRARRSSAALQAERGADTGPLKPPPVIASAAPRVINDADGLDDARADGAYSRVRDRDFEAPPPLAACTPPPAAPWHSNGALELTDGGDVSVDGGDSSVAGGDVSVAGGDSNEAGGGSSVDGGCSSVGGGDSSVWSSGEWVYTDRMRHTPREAQRVGADFTGHVRMGEEHNSRRASHRGEYDARGGGSVRGGNGAQGSGSAHVGSAHFGSGSSWGGGERGSRRDVGGQQRRAGGSPRGRAPNPFYPDPFPPSPFEVERGAPIPHPMPHPRSGGRATSAPPRSRPFLSRREADELASSLRVARGEKEREAARLEAEWRGQARLHEAELRAAAAMELLAKVHADLNIELEREGRGRPLLRPHGSMWSEDGWWCNDSRE